MLIPAFFRTLTPRSGSTGQPASLPSIASAGSRGVVWPEGLEIKDMWTRPGFSGLGPGRLARAQPGAAPGNVGRNGPREEEALILATRGRQDTEGRLGLPVPPRGLGVWGPFVRPRPERGLGSERGGEAACGGGRGRAGARGGGGSRGSPDRGPLPAAAPQRSSCAPGLRPPARREHRSLMAFQGTRFWAACRIPSSVAGTAHS